MKDKIILITGATGGIGKAAAIALAKQKFTIVIHGRDWEKTNLTRQEIIKQSGNQNVDMFVADLFLMSDVRKLADEFKQRYGHLDVLINNAGGIMGRQMQLTKEGFEKTFAVNLLAPFLLTTQLLEHLGKGDEGRIINVSSNSHELNAKPDFNDLQMKRRYTPLGAYGNSKLFLIWISQHLSKDLKDTLKERITVNTVHPGAVRTGFGTASDLGSVLNFISKLARPFFRTPEQGADTVVYLATNKEVGTVSGKYFVDRKQAKVSAKYYSNEREQQIWDYCKSLLAHHLV